MVHRSTTQTGVNEEFHLQIARGQITGHSVVQKFGRNAAVGAVSYALISPGATYPMVQTGSATTLRVKAGDVVDTAAGAGAREITLVGLDETGAEVTETLATAGTSASATTTATFIRLYRAFVSASGSYATDSTQSHDSDIVIENGSGGTNWLTIDSTTYARSQSEVAAYTVPLGYTAYILSIIVHVDAAQSASVLLMKREKILDTAAPYKAMRLVSEIGGAIAGQHSVTPVIPLGPFNELTDIIFLSLSGASTADVSINYDLLLIKDDG